MKGTGEARERTTAKEQSTRTAAGDKMWPILISEMV